MYLRYLPHYGNTSVTESLIHIRKCCRRFVRCFIKYHSPLFVLKLFKLKAAVSYQYYRLVVKANHGGEHFQLSEIELFVNK